MARFIYWPLSFWATGVAIGIITIEDVIEELMGREILDETDHFADNERTITVNDAFRGQVEIRGIHWSCVRPMRA